MPDQNTRQRTTRQPERPNAARVVIPPKAIAYDLGVSVQYVRQRLREFFPHHSRQRLWRLSEAQARFNTLGLRRGD